MKDFIIPWSDDRDMGTPAKQGGAGSTLTIDGFEVTVPEGTSVMRAAAELGMSIPKLCASRQPRGLRLLPVVRRRDRGAARHARLLHHAGGPPAWSCAPSRRR